jgi:hypothetical protein
MEKCTICGEEYARRDLAEICASLPAEEERFPVGSVFKTSPNSFNEQTSFDVVQYSDIQEQTHRREYNTWGFLMERGEIRACSKSGMDPKYLATIERAKLALPTLEEMTRIKSYLNRIVFLEDGGTVKVPDRDRTQAARDLATHVFVAVDPSQL